MILGNILTITAMIAPVFFKNSWEIVPRYYIVLFVMTAILAFIRGMLVRVFPDIQEFARPKEHGKKLALLEFFYRGGMPSGHAATITFFCILLLIAYPNTIVLLFGILSIIIVAVFRYCQEYHTITQLIAGAISGLITVIATSDWILH